jgi:hypothetical protein
MNNFEGGYKDSYQKRDRLREELRLAIEDFNFHSKDPQKDLDVIKESLAVVKEKMSKVGELKKESESLEIKLRDKKEEAKHFENMEKSPNKVDSLDLIVEEESSLHERMFEIDEMIEILMGEIDSIMNEQVGLVGDSDSSIAAMEMKLEKIEELKKQIKELDDKQNF